MNEMDKWLTYITYPKRRKSVIEQIKLRNESAFSESCMSNITIDLIKQQCANQTKLSSQTRTTITTFPHLPLPFSMMRSSTPSIQDNCCKEIKFLITCKRTSYQLKQKQKICSEPCMSNFRGNFHPTKYCRSNNKIVTADLSPVPINKLHTNPIFWEQK